MFDFNKIDDFDRHIALSIPGYDKLTEQICQYAEYFIEQESNVYDIGCSTGKLMRLLPQFENVQYLGIDNSNLLPESVGNYHFLNADLGLYEGFENASLVCSVFTLQFLPSVARRKVIERIAEALNPGGAFIVCEKIFSPSAKLQNIINSLYYEHKQQYFGGDEILRKERDLRSNMRIRSMAELMDEIQFIGVTEVFWKSFNFVGLIVTK